LVLDLNAGANAGSNPSNLTNVDGTLFFTADDGKHDAELWKSNGTAAGTVLVKDLGPLSSVALPTNFTASNGRLFFTFSDGSHGNELWESDGTASGTKLVADLNPGAGSSNPTNLTDFNGTLFFTADDGSDGPALWKTDGTATGTVLVKALPAGQLTAAGQYLYFSAPLGTDGIGLWRTDGTAAGTISLLDVTPSDLTAFNGQLFFSGIGVLFEGTAIYGYGDGSPDQLTTVGSNLFFRSNGDELWVTDGIYPDATRVYDGTWQLNDLTASGGKVYFVSVSSTGTNSYLLVSDGTAGGTQPVLWSGGLKGPLPSNLTDVGGMLFFTAGDGALGHELWQSDGTPAGTVAPQDLQPGPGDSNPQDLTNVNGTLFFTADDGMHGRELWKATPDQGLAVAAGGPYTPTEGDSVTLQATVSDPAGGPLTYAWDLNGHGTFTDATGPSPTLTWAQLRALGIGEGGSRAVRVRVTDSQGNVFTSAPAPLSVQDAPLVATGLTVSATEGATFSGAVASFTDPDADEAGPYRATIDWGDWTVTAGTVIQSGGSFIVSGTHAYASATTKWGFGYGVQVTITDGSGTVTATGTAQVADAPLEASGTSFSPMVDVPFGVTATTPFSDPAPAPGLWAYQATISWGDGQTSAGSVGQDGSGGYTVTGWHTYAAAGTYPVAVQIQDWGGATATVSTSVVVSLPSPFASAGGPYTVTEGGSLTLQATASDPAGGTLTYGWDVNGDGTFTDATGASPTLTWAQLRGLGIGDGGSAAVRVRVTDGQGNLFISDPVSLTVQDAPLAATGLTVSATEGATFSGAVASFTDPDPDEAGPYTATIDWGDGTTTAGTVDPTGGSFAVSGMHVYTAAGQDAVQVTITDGAGTATASSVAVVTAPSLTASAGGPYAVTEGGSLTLQATPSSAGGALTYSWDVNGDGTFGDATGASPTLTWARLRALGLDGGNTYSVQVRVTDAQGNVVTSAAVPLAVRDAPLAQVVALPVWAREGTAFNGPVVSFLDPGGSDPVAHYTASIDWGDGTSSAGTVGPSGYFLRAYGNHTYAQAGSYTVRVTVADGAGPVTATEAVQVADAPLYAHGGSYTLTAGAAYNGPVASFRDANPLSTAADYQAVIAWGDGSTSAGVVTADGKGGFVVSGGHTYAAAGQYPAVVQVQDAGGSAATAHPLMAVRAPSLTATAGGPYTVTEGGSLTLHATASGSAGGPLSYSWDVNGDGAFTDATGASPALTWAQLRALGLDGGTSYSVRVRVTDSVGDTVTSSPVALAVRDAPLQRMTALLVRATEGAAFTGPVASFLDPGGSDPAAHYRATIAWGDGTTTAGTVGPSGSYLRVYGGHTYARAGSYTVRVTVADAAGPVTATEAVQVADAPLYARGGAYGAAAGVAYAGPVASFRDANPLGAARDFRAVIAWGDGSTSAGAVTSDGKGAFVVGGRHTYAAAGRYTAVVQVLDSGGAAASARTLLVVSAPPHVRPAPVAAARRRAPQSDGDGLPLGRVA
jgi:ELWxxDGT repeat protein